MSLGLQATKRRIASVNSTKKITKAMQLVATAKLKTMKKNLTATSSYADEVALIAAAVMRKIPADQWKDVFDFGDVRGEGTVYLLISSSLGLCGGYNYSVFRHALPLIDKEKDLIVAIGSKGVSFFRNRGYRVDDSYADAMTNFGYARVNTIAKYLMYLYASGKCAQVKILYTHYKNQITFVPVTEELFPFSSFDTKVEQLTRKESDMIVEPSCVEVAQKLLPLYLRSVLFSRMNESLLSEYASRRNAMESATDNAEEIVSQLQIEFNKARQAAITQEITEVVGGANASQ